MRIAMILISAAALAMSGCGDDGGSSPRRDAGTGSVDAGGGGGDGGGAADAGVIPDGGVMLGVDFCCAAGTGRTGGATGGTDFDVNCGIGKIVTGFEGYASTSRIWGFQLRCADLRPVMIAENEIEVRVGGAGAGTLIGTDAEGDPVRSDCGANSFAKGVYGKSDDSLVYSMGLTCATGTVSSDGRIGVVPASNSDFFGGASGTGYELNCPTGTLMTGLRGRSSAAMGIISVAANCAEASVDR